MPWIPTGGWDNLLLGQIVYEIGSKDGFPAFYGPFVVVDVKTRKIKHRDLEESFTQLDVRHFVRWIGTTNEFTRGRQFGKMIELCKNMRLTQFMRVVYPEEAIAKDSHREQHYLLNEKPEEIIAGLDIDKQSNLMNWLEIHSRDH